MIDGGNARGMDKETALALALEMEAYIRNLVVTGFVVAPDGSYGVTYVLGAEVRVPITSRQEWETLKRQRQLQAEITQEFLQRRDQGTSAPPTSMPD